MCLNGKLAQYILSILEKCVIQSFMYSYLHNLFFHQRYILQESFQD